MLTSQTTHTVSTSTGPMKILLVSPIIPDYPNARFPGVICFSEIYQVTGPVLRFAVSIASQGYLVACPFVYHEFEGDRVMGYDEVDTNKGNSHKEQKLLSATDSDAEASLNFLLSQKTCTGRIGATGMCYGGHLATRCALDPRILATVAYFPTDLHQRNLGKPNSGIDTLTRAEQEGIKGEVVLIFGTKDGHVPLEGRNAIRQSLTSIDPPISLSFLELQASHAFIRDSMSKGRFDSAISKVCLELLLETFGRTIGRDLGERLVKVTGEEKLVC